MVIKAFKRGIIPLKDGSYFQHFEEKEHDWIKNPDKFMELRNELTKYNTNFSATFNLKNNSGTKKISILEIKRSVNDLESDKINNKKTATERYLKYIYPDKEFIDDRNITEKIKCKKGKDKGKEKITNSYTIKKIFKNFVYMVFGIIEPKSEKLDIATGGEDMPLLETEEKAEERMPRSKKANESVDKIKEIIKNVTEKSSSSESDKEQSAKGLKIMTPNQLLTRLPILLALKKAGNNSQKLNNEIRQIIYYLYSSKNMSKTVYNHLINSI